jgi:hypothetical protein
MSGGDLAERIADICGQDVEEEESGEDNEKRQHRGIEGLIELW